MDLFNSEGKMLLLSLALIVLILGAMAFYSLKRFAMLENSIIQQGRILHSFIMKIEHQGISSGGSCAVGGNRDEKENTSLASPTAIISAKEQLSKLSDKIEVSDVDSDSDSGSENSDSDSDSNCSDDSKLNLKNIRDIKDIKDLGEIRDIRDINEIKDIFISNTLNALDTLDVLDVCVFNSDVKIVAMEIENIGLNIDLNSLELNFEKRHSSDTDSDSESESDLNEPIQDITVEPFSNVIDITDELTTLKKGLSKMKVNELRELAVKKNLVDNIDSANKIKKEALVKLLQEL
jgi:hypothetical protein